MTRARLLAVAGSLIALASGMLFGGGLVLSGMTKPGKVIGFLDVFGAWDASLAFVMLGAIAVHFVAYRLIRGLPSPLLSGRWSLPTRRDIDLKLVAGAALFGIGWGLGGYCPGPAVVSVAGAAPGAIVFTLAMLAGMFAAGRLERTRSAPASTHAAGAMPDAQAFSAPCGGQGGGG